MRINLITISVLLALLASACATATPPPEPTAVPTTAPITAFDQRGKSFELAQPAQRIISLAPSNTEILFAVGAGSQVVGRDSFSDYPAEALNIVDIGGGFGALDTETILAANPDLVLAAEITPPEQIQALEELGLIVFVLPNPVVMSDLYEILRLAASLTGHSAETETLVASLAARVAVVEEKLAGVTERPLVLYELDGTDPNAPWIPGPGTFIDMLIGMAHAENLGASLQGSWIQISLEEIIVRDPDFILLGDSVWGGVTPEMVAARSGWEALTAVKEGRVFPFDDNLVSRPGPRLVDGLEALAKLLHPDLFQ